jgi:AcrR family transcriptional regulator
MSDPADSRQGVTSRLYALRTDRIDLQRQASRGLARTRQRIVDATRELHGEQGIAATSWDDIAARAGVGVGTVYRHFRSLDELIPACGEITMQVLALPDPATMPALFEHATEPAERIERLVREAFAIYKRAASELRAIRREADVHPRVAQDRDQLDASLNALVATVLEPLDATQQDRAVARALVDLNTWEALRDQGLEPDESIAAVADILASRLTTRQG